ncbi:MAG: hypothetical protein II204_09975, partial [Alistipes sp.]|nr:hypothetical protein [Alistipes sp.]
SIDRIDLDLFSRVRVDGFYVEDYEQDTLLYVKRATAALSSLNIKKDGLRIKSAKADGAKFYLREMQDGELNIRPIVAKLQNPNKKSDFRLYISDIDATNLDFCYTTLRPRLPEYGMDYGDIRIMNVDAHLEDFSVIKGVVRGDIKHFAADERSGIRIDDLSGRMYVFDGFIHVDDLRIKTPYSSLYMPRMHINGEDWLQYKDYINNVQMDMVAANSSISSTDIGYFAPALRNWGITLRDVDVTFAGTVADFEATARNVALGEGSSIDATAHVTGQPEWRTANYVVGVEDMHITSADVNMLLDAVLKNPLPDKVMDIINRVDWVDMRATFGGSFDSFRVAGNVNSSVGALRADVSLDKLRNSRYRINGMAKSSSLALGTLLNLPKMGRIDATVNTAATFGSMASGGVVGDVNLLVNAVNYAGYTYHDISGVGKIDGKKFYGEVNAADPNLEFDMFADVDIEDVNPYYRLSMNLAQVDLHALGVNKRDEISTLSANIGVNINGASLEELNGYVSIADAEYHYPGGDIYSNRFRIDLDSDPHQKYVQCRSDFFDFDFRSQSSYRDIYNYLYNSLKTYVPLLYDNVSEGKASNSTLSSTNDY